MADQTHQTAPTQFVDGAGIRFAYRRFEKNQGVPVRLFPAFHQDHGQLGPGRDQRLGP
jgi:hypothetical protein